MSEFEKAVQFFNCGQMDLTHWLTGLFIILALVVAICALVGKVSQIVGKPIGWVRRANQEHEDVQKLKKDYVELKKQQDVDRKNSIEHDKKIEKRQDDIYKLLLDTRIDSMRSEIINFAAQISSGMKFHKDAFDHIYEVHGKYEKLLQENGLKNGVMQASMKIIDEKFQELIDGMK